MNILITNAYSVQNKGDASIILAMIEGFRRHFPDSKITVLSRHAHPTDQKAYGVETTTSILTLARPITSTKPSFFLRNLRDLYVILASLIWGLVYRLTRKSLNIILTQPLRTVLNKYQTADLVVAGGGGYLKGASSPKGLINLFMLGYQFAYGSLLGKPVYLAAQSIGPFQGVSAQLLAKFLLKTARVIESREPITTHLLHKLGLAEKTVEVADLAFAMSKRNKAEAIRVLKNYGLNDDSRHLIGLSIRNWFSDPRAQQCFEDEVVKLITWLISTYQFQICFFPQTVVSSLNDDDRVCAFRIKKQVPDKSFTIIDKDLSVHTLDALTEHFYFHLGMRMHSNIFALRHQTPVIAIAYEPKTTGIMNQLGLSQWVIPVEIFSTNKAKARCKQLFNPGIHQTYKAQLQQRIREVSRCAAQSIDYIIKDYQDYDSSS